MRDSATWALARSILRRNWRASVFLVVFVGLSGAAAMTAWEFSRRAETVIDRRVDRVRPADGVLNTCPPGEDPGVDIRPCFATESNQIAFEVLRTSPFVVASSLVVSAQLVVSATETGPSAVVFGSANVGNAKPVGEPLVVSGRPAAPESADEVVLTETLARRLGVGAGSSVWVAGCDFDFGAGTSDCGPPQQMRATGIVRVERDLLPARRVPPGATITDDTDFGLFAGVGVYDSLVAQWAAFPQTGFRLAPGSTLDDVRGDMESRLPPGWTVLVAPPEDASTFEGLRRSTHLQAGALLAIAAILALAGAVFVSQALMRQIRRELAEHAVVSALGMTTADLVRIALARLVPIAIASGALAGVVAVVASGQGPTSLAGRAEVDPGVRFDATVVAIGATVVTAIVLGVSALAAARSLAPPAPSRRVGATSMQLSATASAGFALGRSSRSGGGGRIAVLGVAAAVVGVIAAGVLVDSLGAVTSRPRHYGASWEYSFADLSDSDSIDAVAAEMIADPLLTDVAFVYSSGPVSIPSASSFSLVGFESVKGDLGPVIVDGRAPISDDEVAVGVGTLDELGLSVGDVIESIPIIASGGAADESTTGTIGPLRIVGSAVIADDTRGVGPGFGMVLTEGARRRVDPAASPVVLVRADPTVPVEAAVRRLETAYGQLTVPSPQSDLSNVVLISDTPWVIALLVAALALGALAHALITVVRRARREIGILRSLGFTRSQVSRSVSWCASRVGVLGLAIGVPLGVIVGRLAWSRLATEIGVTLGPVVSVGVPLLAVAVVFVCANLVAAGPAWRAQFEDVAESLRDG